MNNCSNGRLNWGEPWSNRTEYARHAIIKAAIDPTSPKSCSAQVTHRLDLDDWAVSYTHLTLPTILRV